MTEGIAPIDTSLMPAAVRNGSQQRKDDYQAALSFERVLVGQLTEQLTKGFGGDDDDKSGDAASQMMKQELPSTLADALMQGGGIGLATQMDQMWHQGQDAPKTTSLGDASKGAGAALPTDGSAEA